jgi:low temperature requirement protein LtrA
MSGRDPHEQFRVATSLELLFDLTFVVGFGTAASEFARSLSANQVGSGLAGFAFATFAVWWAWVNFSWFASAYDTDDWVYRLTTMLQMAGVIVLALGLPQMFASMHEGPHVDNRVMVAGYVVMRIAMVAQWLRAARQDPDHRPACLTYVVTVTVAQIGWVGVIFAHASFGVTFLLMVPLFILEVAGPWIAETRKGGTPWHAHHIVERFGLLTIIALGEGVIGTVASLSSVVAAQGWTGNAVLVAVAGIGLTFGMWWTYYSVPAADLLHAHRQRAFSFGYLHLLIIGAIVATGAGCRRPRTTSNITLNWVRWPRCWLSRSPSRSTSRRRICCMRCSFTPGTRSTWCWSRSRRWCWSRRWPWPRAGSRWRCAW